MEALKKKKKDIGETQEIIFDDILSFPPALNANVLFCRFLFESYPVYDQTQGIWCCLFLTLLISLMYNIGLGFHLLHQDVRFKVNQFVVSD